MAKNTIEVLYKGGSSKNSKTSAKASVDKALSKKTNSSSLNESLVDKAFVSRFKEEMSMVTNPTSFSLVGFAGKFGAVGVATGIALNTSSKIIDFVLDYDSAVTGNTVNRNNIKQAKSRILNPGKVIGDLVEVYTSIEPRIRRENTSNDYFRNLSGNFIDGKQYGKEKK